MHGPNRSIEGSIASSTTKVVFRLSVCLSVVTAGMTCSELKGSSFHDATEPERAVKKILGWGGLQLLSTLRRASQMTSQNIWQSKNGDLSSLSCSNPRKQEVERLEIG